MTVRVTDRCSHRDWKRVAVWTGLGRNGNRKAQLERLMSSNGVWGP